MPPLICHTQTPKDGGAVHPRDGPAQPDGLRLLPRGRGHGESRHVHGARENPGCDVHRLLPQEYNDWGHAGAAQDIYTQTSVSIQKNHIPPHYVVEPVIVHRKPPEVRIWRLRNQSCVGTVPPSTSTPHWPACCARR